MRSPAIRPLVAFISFSIGLVVGGCSGTEDDEPSSAAGAQSADDDADAEGAFVRYGITKDPALVRRLDELMKGHEAWIGGAGAPDVKWSRIAFPLKVNGRPLDSVQSPLYLSCSGGGAQYQGTQTMCVIQTFVRRDKAGSAALTVKGDFGRFLSDLLAKAASSDANLAKVVSCDASSCTFEAAKQGLRLAFDDYERDAKAEDLDAKAVFRAAEKATSK